MTLLVTNDFPPRVGGIEAFNRQLCSFLDDQVVVLTGAGQGGLIGRDPDFPFPVHRTSAAVLLPTPETTQLAVKLMRRYAVRRVVFSAAAPLALMAGELRAAGAHRIVAVSHGHEVWWSRVPGSRQLLGRIGAECDHLTWVSEFTREAVADALDPTDRARMRRLSPPVDPTLFTPADDRDGLWGGEKAPAKVVLSAGRFVAQKGFDTLLRAWQLVAKDHPEAILLIAGDGPQASALMRLRDRLGLGERVRFLGPRAHRTMPEFLRLGSIFALPVKSRLAGLNAEGFGLSFAEAAAAGLAVIAGDSGGAPETMVPGETGSLVRPGDHHTLAAVLSELLADPARVAAMGSAGRRHVIANFSADRARTMLRSLLDLEESEAPVESEARGDSDTRGDSEARGQ